MVFFGPGRHVLPGGVQGLSLIHIWENRPCVTMEDLQESIIKVIAGPAKKSRVVTENARKLTAWHEAGHAVVMHTLPTHDPVHQITIVPRGQAGGMTISLPEEDKPFRSRTEPVSYTHLDVYKRQDVDTVISGLNKSDLILLAARPGMGKTSLALNILLYAGKHSGKACVFFSLEMSREQLAMRLLSNESFVDNKKLTTGQLSDEDWEKVALATSALNHSNILIDDNPSLSVADMNAKCRRVENLGLVVIDYLQLMTSAGGKNQYSGESRQQVVSDISRALKIMAKELNVPVICLSQLSRANENRPDKRPRLSDLRESGAIEQDADIVMFIYRDDYYDQNSENHNQAECIVAKNRHGELATVPLQWLPEFTTFSSVDWKHQEP